MGATTTSSYTTTGSASKPAPQPTDRAERADILIFSPHPDDESIGCSGLIMQALSQGKQVRVVFFTNGDGYPLATSLLFQKPYEELTRENYLDMARIRQQEAIKAMTTLGLKQSDVIFLGYPDAGLVQVYEATGPQPFTLLFTQQSATYGALVDDYHTQRHGSPAPYVKQSVLNDIVDLVRRLQPGQIYVSAEVDTHPDHQAAFWFVRDGLKLAGYRGDFYIYVIHGGPESHWPWPRGVTPTQPFESIQLEGLQIPIGVSWPPSQRIPVNEEQNKRKLRAIHAYESQTRIEAEKRYLESFIKSEEIFWRLND